MSGELQWIQLPIAAKVLQMYGLQHWYHTGGLPQLWYFPELQVHIEHVSHDITVDTPPQEPEADAIQIWLSGSEFCVCVLFLLFTMFTSQMVLGFSGVLGDRCDRVFAFSGTSSSYN
ncbi:hypothetical protein CHARACLAT_029211 [Characodon lateralis]|uniref:Uncharacterized protein n=1 Tax=Characodon lateralis TaxID=208331 RepID=A0ABU7F710_9TELE|nr:hypothetical protein [Characodon lateralis]